MRRFSGPRLALAAALAALAATTGVAACGAKDDVGPSGHTVGARCTADNDCAKRCFLGSDFPNGYCSQTCTADKDCPGGTACIMATDKTGACMVTCKVPNDCNGFGAGYQCNRQGRQESGAEGALVCTGA